MGTITRVSHPGEVAETLRGLADRDPFIGANVSRWEVSKVLLGEGAYVLIAGAEPRRMAVGRGTDHGLVRLLARTAREMGALTFALMPRDAEVTPIMTGALGLEPEGTWEWLWTRQPPPAVAGEDRCGPLGADARGEIAALLSHANPSTSARPTDDQLTWWGYRDDDGRLLSACAVQLPTTPADGVHLSGFGTDPAARGRGIGTAMMAAMTRWGVQTHGLVHYGVWSDNAGALRIYERLGYQVEASLRNFRRC